MMDIPTLAQIAMFFMAFGLLSLALLTDTV